MLRDRAQHPLPLKSGQPASTGKGPNRGLNGLFRMFSCALKDLSYRLAIIGSAIFCHASFFSPLALQIEPSSADGGGCHVGHESLRAFSDYRKAGLEWVNSIRWRGMKLRSLSEASILVRRGKISPLELTRDSLQQIAQLNPTLNAFVTVL